VGRKANSAPAAAHIQATLDLHEAVQRYGVKYLPTAVIEVDGRYWIVPHSFEEHTRRKLRPVPAARACT
jgi:hypothetical protein